MFSNASRNKLSLLIFNATAWVGIADNAASSPITNIYASLHTALPGRTGNQSSSEASYTNYARVAIPRSSTGFTVAADGTTTLTSQRQFPASSPTGNNQYCPFVAFGSASSGTGEIEQQGAIIKSGTTAIPVTMLAGTALQGPAHGAAVNDRVCLLKIGAAPLPGNFTEGTVYWVVSSADANTVTLSATQGGGAITASSAGCALMLVLDGFQIGNNYTPQLTTSSAIYID
jgi:hypothetical protein